MARQKSETEGEKLVKIVLCQVAIGLIGFFSRLASCSWAGTKCRAVDFSCLALELTMDDATTSLVNSGNVQSPITLKLTMERSIH